MNNSLMFIRQDTNKANLTYISNHSQSYHHTDEEFHPQNILELVYPLFHICLQFQHHPVLPKLFQPYAKMYFSIFWNIMEQIILLVYVLFNGWWGWILQIKIRNKAVAKQTCHSHRQCSPVPPRLPEIQPHFHCLQKVTIAQSLLSHENSDTIQYKESYMEVHLEVL